MAGGSTSPCGLRGPLAWGLLLAAGAAWMNSCVKRTCVETALSPQCLQQGWPRLQPGNPGMSAGTEPHTKGCPKAGSRTSPAEAQPGGQEQLITQQKSGHGSLGKAHVSARAKMSRNVWISKCVKPNSFIEQWIWTLYAE